jgi:hypothetical protein
MNLKPDLPDSAVPAALLLAERVNDLKVAGHFDEVSGTWSNRDYECASRKKHSESR